MKNLTGRVAVVTGAASGIGLAMVKQFAGEGMKLLLADIEVVSLASVLAELRAAGATGSAGHGRSAHAGHSGAAQPDRGGAIGLSDLRGCEPC